jgi:hypothetical protein
MVNIQTQGQTVNDVQYDLCEIEEVGGEKGMVKGIEDLKVEMLRAVGGEEMIGLAEGKDEVENKIDLPDPSYL